MANIFKYIFLKENFRILIKISLKLIVCLGPSHFWTNVDQLLVESSRINFSEIMVQ